MSKAILMRSTISGLLAKAASLIVLVAILPLVKDHLSAEGFGVWITLTSLSMVIQFADFGVGNGLVNVISTHLGDGDREPIQTAVSSSIAMLLAISVGISISSFPFLATADWVGIFKVSELPNSLLESTTLVFAAITIGGIPAVIGQKILWGFQEVHIANYWQIAGSMLTIILVISAIALHGNLAWLVAASTSGTVISLVASSLDQLRRRKWLRPERTRICRRMGSRLLRLGGMWSLYQLMFFAATSADGVFVTWLFGIKSMGSYGVMMRLVAGMAITLFFTVSLWPIFAEALVRRDLWRISHTFRLTIALCTFIGIVTAVVLIGSSQWIVRAWAGPLVVPPRSVVYAFAAWSFVYNVWAGVSSLLGNEKLLRQMVIIAGSGSLIALTLKVPLAERLGPAGICWASVIGIGVATTAGVALLVREIRMVKMQVGSTLDMT